MLSTEILLQKLYWLSHTIVCSIFPSLLSPSIRTTISPDYQINRLRTICCVIFIKPSNSCLAVTSYFQTARHHVKWSGVIQQFSDKNQSISQLITYHPRCQWLMCAFILIEGVWIIHILVCCLLRIDIVTPCWVLLILN